ncbi:MAG: hypothetical protein KatS3mg068_1356 [Candidatus Sericytochromatia bacterium]|nr:MAG: hypothetical protein KatS3mg068_1356 [Candidatus Sericytochromatia bacterium]
MKNKQKCIDIINNPISLLIIRSLAFLTVIYKKSKQKENSYNSKIKDNNIISDDTKNSKINITTIQKQEINELAEVENILQDEKFIIYKKLLYLKDKFFFDLPSINLEPKNIDEAIKSKNQIEMISFDNIILNLANNKKLSESDLIEINKIIEPEYTLIIPKIGERIDTSICNPVKFIKKEGEKRGVITNISYIGLKKKNIVVKCADVEIVNS